jgi:hypothetical protein
MANKVLILAWVAHDPHRAIYEQPMAAVWSRDIEGDLENGMDYAKRNNMTLMLMADTHDVLELARRKIADEVMAKKRNAR